VHRHEFLRKLHEVYRPRTYLEIGINDGRSLALSRVPTVAVDPAFKVVKELRCDLHMVRATSDDFFARENPLEHLRGARVDLAFIDGMHLFEYALRDFINVEAYTDWSSVVVFDDQLPRNVDEAARNRHTGAWTGDVYKMIPALQRYRPDLRLAVVNTRPTGMLVVFGTDPSNRVLRERYSEILDRYLIRDPQQLPAELVERTCAIPPEALLEAAFWSALVSGRDKADSSYGREQLLVDIDKALDGLPRPALSEWAPDPRRGRDREIDPSVSVGEAQMMAEIRRRKTAERAEAQTRASGGPPSRLRRALVGRLVRRARFLRKVPGAPALGRKLR
jgi:hypothetical protein